MGGRQDAGWRANERNLARVEACINAKTASAAQELLKGDDVGIRGQHPHFG